jgi:hypothetical protein
VTLPIRVQILLPSSFPGFIPGFTGIIHLVSDVPVDNDTLVATSIISRSVGTQSFRGASGDFENLRYTLSGKRRSHRRRGASDDFENLQICGCSVLQKCS